MAIDDIHIHLHRVFEKGRTAPKWTRHLLSLGLIAAFPKPSLRDGLPVYALTKAGAERLERDGVKFGEAIEMTVEEFEQALERQKTAIKEN